MIEQLLRDHLSGHSAQRVLDAGPGYGPFGRAACQATGARHLSVVDVDMEVLRYQREEAKRARIGLDIEVIEALLTPGALSALPSGRA
jgi:16S rRNA G1207 methylase RsmC